LIVRLGSSPLFLIHPAMGVLLPKNFAGYYESVFKLYQSLENAFMKSPSGLLRNSTSNWLCDGSGWAQLQGLADLGGRG